MGDGWMDWNGHGARPEGSNKLCCIEGELVELHGSCSFGTASWYPWPFFLVSTA